MAPRGSWRTPLFTFPVTLRASGIIHKQNLRPREVGQFALGPTVRESEAREGLECGFRGSAQGRFLKARTYRKGWEARRLGSAIPSRAWPETRPCGGCAGHCTW